MRYLAVAYLIYINFIISKQGICDDSFFFVVNLLFNFFFKWAADQKVTKAEATVIKQEEDLKKLQDKIKEFTEKCNELEAVSYSHEANAKSSQQQLDIMMVSTGSINILALSTTLSSCHVL